MGVHGRLKSLATSAALVLGSCVLALGAVEVGLRWWTRTRLPAQDLIDLRALGFRWGVYAFQKPEGTVRVVGIGDSFAYGAVPPVFNYHALLESELAARLRRRVEVINLGRPGLGPGSELSILRDFALRFQPDVVLWTFFTGNDFTDDPPGRDSSLEEILGALPWELNRAGGVSTAWYGRLRVAGFLRLPWALLRAGTAWGPSLEAPTLDEEAFIRVETTRMRVLLDAGMVAESFRFGVRPRLARAISLCAQRGIPFVLAVAPDQAEIEESLARTVLARLAHKGSLRSCDEDSLAEALRRGDLHGLTHAYDSLATLASRGATVVSLYEPFRLAGSHGGLYLARHTHWNREGNRLAADLLAEPLVRLLDARVP